MRKRRSERAGKQKAPRTTSLTSFHGLFEQIFTAIYCTAGLRPVEMHLYVQQSVKHKKTATIQLSAI